MPAILTTIGTRNPEGGNAPERCAAAVVPLIEAAGGRVLCRATFREAIVGDGPFREIRTFISDPI